MEQGREQTDLGTQAVNLQDGFIIHRDYLERNWLPNYKQKQLPISLYNQYL